MIHKCAVLIFVYFTILMSITGCGSDAKELLDLALNPPSRKTIDTSRMGINAFFVNPGFGTIEERYNDIQNNLGIKSIRVLLAWTNEVQPTPNSPINFSLFDNILNSAPPGVEILIVATHTPDWMTNSANWVNGNPRLTWVEKWFKPVLQRYKNNPRIVGYEIFNEPNLLLVQSDSVLGLGAASNYFELLSMGAAAVRSIAPNVLVVLGATESINQKFPQNLDYNKELQELGAADLVDIWAVHYYSEQFERVIRSGGIADFLNGLPNLIWITESGEQGFNEQLAYAETTWPFLREKISRLDKIFFYQYSEPTPSDITFGLRNPDPNFGTSDLYIHLRDR